jgi:hypothetical protein
MLAEFNVVAMSGARSLEHTDELMARPIQAAAHTTIIFDLFEAAARAAVRSSC